MVRRPVAERNKPIRIRGGVFFRVKAPSRFNVVKGYAAPGGAADVLSGYRKAELKMGSKFRSEFTADQIKKAWSRPE